MTTRSPLHRMSSTVSAFASRASTAERIDWQIRTSPPESAALAFRSWPAQPTSVKASRGASRQHIRGRLRSQRAATRSPLFAYWVFGTDAMAFAADYDRRNFRRQWPAETRPSPWHSLLSLSPQPSPLSPLPSEGRGNEARFAKYAGGL